METLQPTTSAPPLISSVNPLSSSVLNAGELGLKSSLINDINDFNLNRQRSNENKRIFYG